MRKLMLKHAMSDVSPSVLPSFGILPSLLFFFRAVHFSGLSLTQRGMKKHGLCGARPLSKLCRQTAPIIAVAANNASEIDENAVKVF